MPESDLPLNAEQDVHIGDGEAWPSTLYRFRAATSEEDFSRLKNIFEDHELYFSGSASLNDPFDCSPVFDVPESGHQLETLLRHIGRRHASSMTANQLKKYIEDRLKDRPALEQQLRASFFDVVDAVSVCCFSSSWDIPLLWSHYAAGHSGVCIEFSGNKPKSFMTLPVKYTNIRPVVSPTFFSRRSASEAGDIIDHVLLTKSDVWSYEKEWRSIKQRSRPGPQKFNPEIISAVIFGHRATSEVRNRVATMMSDGGVACPTFVAELDPREFSFRRVQIG